MKQTKRQVEAKQLALQFMSMDDFDIEGLLENFDSVCNEFFIGTGIEMHDVLAAFIRNWVNFVTEITDNISSYYATLLIITEIITAGFYKNHDLAKLIKTGLKKKWSFAEILVAMKPTLRQIIKDLFEEIIIEK